MKKKETQQEGEVGEKDSGKKEGKKERTGTDRRRATDPNKKKKKYYKGAENKENERFLLGK